MNGHVWSSSRENAERILELIDRAFKLLESFEQSLLDGSLERELEALYTAITEAGAGHVVAEKALLLARYAHALRIRVVSLRSTRGLSRARDEIANGLAEIRSSISRRDNAVRVFRRLV